MQLQTQFQNYVCNFYNTIIKVNKLLEHTVDE